MFIHYLNDDISQCYPTPPNDILELGFNDTFKNLAQKGKNSNKD